MAYTPHTEKDVAEMLEAIGAKDVDELFRDIPEGLLLDEPLDLGAMNEYELTRFFECAAAQNAIAEPGRLFLGGGAYQHYVPAAVKTLLQRGEFVTSYTPYQAEVSQGTLQAIYEFQSHIAALTGMEVANASMYDGATSLAEALLMAIRHTGVNRVYLPETLHPHYAAVCRTYMAPLGIEILELPRENGVTDYEGESQTTEPAAAVVLQTPNFFGVLEQAHEARALADRTGALLIAVCNPTSLAVVTPPGEYGADIAVGEAQPLGIPLQFGGPYCGYFATKTKLIRKMPGRLVGKTTDDNGDEGFVLTLQTREQHIRRERATSNICTNQGLFALMVTMYLTFTGQEGLVEVAETCMANTQFLADELTKIQGVRPLFADKPYFHEIALRLPVPAKEFLRTMRTEHGIVAGLDLSEFHSELENAVMICATEMATEEDLRQYVRAARSVIAALSAAVPEPSL